MINFPWVTQVWIALLDHVANLLRIAINLRQSRYALTFYYIFLHLWPVLIPALNQFLLCLFYTKSNQSLAFRTHIYQRLTTQNAAGILSYHWPYLRKQFLHYLRLMDGSWLDLRYLGRSRYKLSILLWTSCYICFASVNFVYDDVVILIIVRFCKLWFPLVDGWLLLLFLRRISRRRRLMSLRLFKLLQLMLRCPWRIFSAKFVVAFFFGRALRGMLFIIACCWVVLLAFFSVLSADWLFNDCLLERLVVRFRKSVC